jgi:hypothetical protein
MSPDPGRCLRYRETADDGPNRRLRFDLPHSLEGDSNFQFTIVQLGLRPRQLAARDRSAIGATGEMQALACAPPDGRDRIPCRHCSHLERRNLAGRGAPNSWLRYRGLVTSIRTNPRTTGQFARGIRAALEAAAHASEPARTAFGRVRPKLINLCAITFTLAISGCAGNAPQPETRPGAASLTGAEAPKCHIAHALLVLPPAPDCGFGRSELKTVDPDQWARLKLEFERKCFQHAEKMVRERLRQLQAATNRCGTEQASRWAKS